MLSDGWQAVERPEKADLLLVNTCGFIQPAVEEAIEAALELAEAKTAGQRLVVAGCLVGRYGKKLAAGLPEADLLLAPGEAPNLLAHLAAPPPGRLAISPPRSLFGGADPRALSTGPGLGLSQGVRRLRPVLRLLHHPPHSRPPALPAPGRSAGRGRGPGRPGGEGANTWWPRT